MSGTQGFIKFIVEFYSPPLGAFNAFKDTPLLAAREFIVYVTYHSL